MGSIREMNEANEVIISMKRSRTSQVRVPAQERSTAMVEAIMEASCAVALERGTRRTTIRAVAARAGCGVGSVYDYFRSRDDLLLRTRKRLASLDGTAAPAKSLEAVVHLALALRAEGDAGRPTAVARVTSLLAAMAKERGLAIDPTYWSPIAETVVASASDDDELANQNVRDWLGSLLDAPALRQA